MRQARRIDSRGPSDAAGRVVSFLMKAFLCVMVALAAAGLFAPSTAQAAIIAAGNVNPATDPVGWTNATAVYIGETADGSVTVNGGSTLLSGKPTVLGCASGITGTLTVDGGTFQTKVGTTSGPGGNPIYLGYAGGTGVLNITNGGSAVVWGQMFVGYGLNGGTGTINITNGGSLTFSTFYGEAALADENQDETGWGLNPGSKATVIIDGVGSSWNGGAVVGRFGAATLSVTNGGTFNGGVTIGEQSTANGTVIVDGVGSTLNGSFSVGYFGHGTLMVTNGGRVVASGIVGDRPPASLGTMVVNGTGSSLTSKILKVGDYSESVSYGNGRLSITDGASVTTSALRINGNSKTVLTIDVGRGSSLTVGTGDGSLFGDGTYDAEHNINHSYYDGTINNHGKIRLVAGASAAAGTYTPMTYRAIDGEGTIQALGGVWDGTARTVTVSGAAAGAGIGGATAAFNLAVAQRAIITDSATGKSVGAGFAAGTANVTFNAVALSPTALAALQGLLASGNTVLSAWNFSATGYTVSASNPVYLSLSAGPGQSLSKLGIWHYDGSTWSVHDAYDLAYNGTYASFTVTGFSGYAVSGTTPTPIPAGVWLLGPALAGLAGMRRRLFRK